ncbi:MAG: flagellar hook-associated protein FlgK, partial [Planctomycetota bacterium]
MSIGITAGLKALFAAQISMQTAGHNIANANSPGYSRQNVLLNTSHAIPFTGVGWLGTGVDTTGIVHTVDDLLEARLRVQNRGLGRLGKESSLLMQVEGIFNEPSDIGLSSLMSKFFAAINDLSLDPQDGTLRSDLLRAGQVLCDGYNTVSNQMTSLRKDVKTELESQVNQVNQITHEIAELTKQIVSQTNIGQPPNDLIDRRNYLCKELNNIIDAEVHHLGNNQISVLISGRLVASQGVQNDIQFAIDDEGTAVIRLEGEFSALDVKDGVLKGLLDHYNTEIPAWMAKMDTLAGQFLYEFNQIHSTGVPVSGPFTYIKSTNQSMDNNFDRDPTNERLDEAGLVFPPSAGSLYVTVTNLSTGQIEQTEIAIDPEDQTLSNVAGSLDNIDHLFSYTDSLGYLNISAEAGYAVDFAPNLNTSPDQAGTFGSKSAMVIGGATFPVTMTAGDTLTILEDGAALPPVTFVGGT